MTPTEHRLQSRDASACHSNANLDYAPQINEDAFFERIRGLGVAVYGVETHDTANGGKPTGAEDQEKGNLLPVWPLDGSQRRNGKPQDPYISYDVERGCRYVWVCLSVRAPISVVPGNRGVRTVKEGCGVDAGTRLGLGKVPHLVKRPALANGDYKTDEEEDSV